MRVMSACLMTLMLALLAGGTAFAGNLNLSAGLRSLDDNDWEPVEDQDYLGATITFGPDDWPVLLAAGLYVSSEEDDMRISGGVLQPIFGPVDVDVKADLAEVSFGVQFIGNRNGIVRPFIGGGLNYVQADIELRSGSLEAEEDDESTGIYGEGGVFWRLGPAFNIGLNVRATLGNEFDIEGEELDGEYIQGGVLLGWGWGS